MIMYIKPSEVEIYLMVINSNRISVFIKLSGTC
jgi:hypothetical protein